MSGHRYSVQNTTLHQIISVNNHQAARLIGFINLPLELMIQILLYLSPLDIISCRCTCRMLYDLCANAIFRYIVQMERSAVSDYMNPGLPYPDRLRILEKQEESWARLNFHRSVRIPITFTPSNHWSVTGGALLLGTAPNGENSQLTMGYSYVTLPSLSDAQNQKIEWKAYNFESEVLDIELAVHEHDMIVALIA